MGNAEYMGSSLQLLSNTRWEVVSQIHQKCNSWLSSSLPLLSTVPLTLVVIILAMLIMMVLIVMIRRITSVTRHLSKNHEECYVDYDIIVDVTEIEECEYVVITHCAEEHEQVYHNSHIVKGESQVVDAHQQGYGYGNGNYVKREAGNQGYSSGPYCQDKKEQQCHKHPKENTRKIPKQTCKNIVDTIYIETCEERIHTQCEETHERGHHSTRVASHDSQIIASSSHSGHKAFYGGSH